MTPRILVVEDEPAIADAVAYALRGDGMRVDVSDTGEEALELAGRSAYDVVVLDVMLPGLSGVEVCRRLRDAGDVPIVMLTARDAEVDRVLGLESGADDYVTKPFSIIELVSRVRAILRRRDLDRSPQGIAVRRVGELVIDLARHRVSVGGESIDVTPSEFRLLALLSTTPDRVFSRREIMQHLWNSSYVGDERACDLHISNLRQKIEPDPKAPARLRTVRGVGYTLSSEI